MSVSRARKLCTTHETVRLHDLLCDVLVDAHVLILTNGNEDPLDVIVLTQLPYDHLHEVGRTSRQTGAGACQCLQQGMGIWRSV